MIKIFNIVFLIGLVSACVPVPSVKDSKLTFRAPNSVAEVAALKDYNSELQMAPRSYIESVLLEVFDAKNTPAATYIQSDIYEKIEFGGACDQYGASDIGLATATFEYDRERCKNSVDVVQKSTNNPMRYSILTKVCERLVIDTERMKSVRKKVLGPTATSWTKPSASSVEAAWTLFYPATPLTSDIQSALINVGKESSSDETAWQHIMLTLCISPQWQVL